MSIKDTAKTILCFGDSNTWGNVPRSDDRYPRSIRWTSVLQKMLGEDYEIISEGLCGRTLAAIDAEKPYLTGITVLPALLQSADPIDLIIIMLGTNDVKEIYGLEAKDIARDLERVIGVIRNENVPNILLICPPAIITAEKKAVSKTGQDLDKTLVRGVEIFKTLPSLYKLAAEKNGCHFLNAGEYISSSKIDGCHFDADAHLKLATVLKDVIEKMNL